MQAQTKLIFFKGTKIETKELTTTSMLDKSIS